VWCANGVSSFVHFSFSFSFPFSQSPLLSFAHWKLDLHPVSHLSPRMDATEKSKLQVSLQDIDGHLTDFAVNSSTYMS
jgi:hypothetical protein